MRVPEALGDDPMLQACAFAYCSDEFPLGTALSVHPVVPDWSRVFTASLDHALWFHRPLRADHWLLYELRAGGVATRSGPPTLRPRQRRRRSGGCSAWRAGPGLAPAALTAPPAFRCASALPG
jgi:hypothetical protein